MTDDVLAWAELAIDTARAAGARLLDYFERDLAIELKSSDIDLVTDADRASEALIVERLRRACPTHAIVAEESGRVVEGNGPCWIIDPLDGTTNFAHRFPHFSVVIGLHDPVHGGLLGVVYDPLRDETFHAVAGRGAWLRSPRYDDVRLHVTATDELGRSLLATGFAYRRSPESHDNVPHFARILDRVRGIRRAGSAALDMAYVAAGRLDGYWEFDLAAWDWAAGAVLVREAGGVAITHEGRAWSPGDTSMIAGPAGLADDLRAALRP